MPSLEVLALDTLPDPADPMWSAWLTPAELGACRGYARSKEHLAARVAGKLAIARECGAGDAEPDWHAVQITQGHQQPPAVLPSGGPAVSLTHAAGWVAALAWWPSGGVPGGATWG
jgi:holo-[acyl-carrier protein] synthase